MEERNACWILYVPIGKDRPCGFDGPLIVFPTRAEAKGAADMIEEVSGERPALVAASYYRPTPQ